MLISPIKHPHPSCNMVLSLWFGDWSEFCPDLRHEVNMVFFILVSGVQVFQACSWQPSEEKHGAAKQGFFKWKQKGNYLHYGWNPGAGWECPRTVYVSVHCAEAKREQNKKSPWSVTEHDDLLNNSKPRKKSYFTLSDPHHCTLLWQSIWHFLWHSIWPIFWHSGIRSGILSGIHSDILPGISYDILVYLLAFYLARLLTFFLASFCWGAQWVCPKRSQTDCSILWCRNWQIPKPWLVAEVQPPEGSKLRPDSEV